MTNHRELRALVVDDELAVRQLLKLALVRQGFDCDQAADGIEAEARVAVHQYDAIVTDLRMPNKHGHALAVRLLDLEDRPVIVVHTGVCEPRLTKDLLIRGVDDVLFKPCDFGLLAAKVRALVDRRCSEAPQRTQVHTAKALANDLPMHLAGSTPLGEPMSPLTSRDTPAELFPIKATSQVALEVYGMTSTKHSDTRQLADAIRQDVALTAEVLRLANSGLYNPSGQATTLLEQAVVRIGHDRIGELALAKISLIDAWAAEMQLALT
jgi:CheY-like chemotaxis protein